MAAEKILKVEVEKIPSTPKIISDTLVARWLKFARVSEKSQKTYDICIRQLFRYFRDNSIVEPSREDIANWVDELIAQKKSPSTVNLYLSGAKLFFRFLSDEGLYPNVCDHLKSGVKVKHNHKKNALTPNQGANLLKSVTGDSEMALRNRVMIALMLSCGLRAIEVQRAIVGDIEEIDGRYFLAIQGKGHSEKDQSVLIPSQVYGLIQNYFESRKNANADSPLFASTSRRNFGKAISVQTISKTVKGYLRAIGLNSRRYTCHSLRHSAACAMLDAGVEIRQIQATLRHINITTTMIYLDEVERLKNSAEQMAADVFFGAM